jgi:head-tail adaptor
LQIEAKTTGKAASMATISGKHTPSELRQVVEYILDTAAMAATIVKLLQAEMTCFTEEMSEIEARFQQRLRRHIEKEARRTIAQRIPSPRTDFEDFLKVHLSPDEIRTALEFQRDQVVVQLRESTLVMSLETDARSNPSCLSVYRPQ